MHTYVQRLVSAVKIATTEEYTTKVQHSVVRFLWAKALNENDIRKEMFPVCCGKCLLRTAVHNWVKKFSQGLSKVTDDARPGRPIETATEATVLQWVEEMIRADRRIKIDNTATALGCSHGLACIIMHDHLKFWKLCA
jgi:hypothetical protein